jgi:mono/diheme cytochrome c family protein
MKTMTRSIFLLSMGLLLTLTAACNETPAPAPPPPTASPALAADVHIPNLEDGQAAWNEAQCAACHGPLALGGIGPQLASTELPYDDFLHVVRTAIPPKPAYDETKLPDQVVYDIYAWVRTQIPPAQFPEAGAGPTAGPTTESPSAEDIMGMTIWTCRGCDGCHGVFAQGGPEAPTLAGLNYPVEEELARMRSTADKTPEHGPDHISDEVFERLYEWIKMGCIQDECYH